MPVISTVLLLSLSAWGGSWPGAGGAARRRARPRRPAPTRPWPARSGPCPALAVPGRGEQPSVSSLLRDSPADRDRHGAPVKPSSTTNTYRRHGVFRDPPVRQVVRQQARPAGRASRPCQQDLLYREGRDQVAEPDAVDLRPCEPKTSSVTRPGDIRRSCRRREPVFGRGTAQDRPVRAPGSSGDAGTTARSG
jgi:hypothetical protein